MKLRFLVSFLALSLLSSAIIAFDAPYDLDAFPADISLFQEPEIIPFSTPCILAIDVIDAIDVGCDTQIIAPELTSVQVEALANAELVPVIQEVITSPLTFAQVQEKFIEAVKNNPKITAAVAVSLAAIIYHRKKVKKIIKKDPVSAAFLFFGGSMVLYRAIFN